MFLSNYIHSSITKQSRFNIYLKNRHKKVMFSLYDKQRNKLHMFNNSLKNCSRNRSVVVLKYFILVIFLTF